MLPFDWQGTTDKTAHLEWLLDFYTEAAQTEKGRESLRCVKEHDIPIMLCEYSSSEIAIQNINFTPHLLINPNKTGEEADYPAEHPLTIMMLSEYLPHEILGHYKNGDADAAYEALQNSNNFISWRDVMIGFEARADFERMTLLMEKNGMEGMPYNNSTLFEAFKNHVEDLLKELELKISNPAINPDAQEQAKLELDYLQNRTMPEYKNLLWAGYESAFNNPDINPNLYHWWAGYAKEYKRVKATNGDVTVGDRSSTPSLSGKIYSGKQIINFCSLLFTDSDIKLAEVIQKSYNPSLQKTDKLAQISNREINKYSALQL
ncbi:MAG: hypothetical protein ACOYK8_04540 [Alphaproteobacteria bacterium]